MSVSLGSTREALWKKAHDQCSTTSLLRDRFVVGRGEALSPSEHLVEGVLEGLVEN